MERAGEGATPAAARSWDDEASYCCCVERSTAFVNCGVLLGEDPPLCTPGGLFSAAELSLKMVPAQNAPTTSRKFAVSSRPPPRPRRRSPQPHRAAIFGDDEGSKGGERRFFLGLLGAVMAPAAK